MSSSWNASAIFFAQESTSRSKCQSLLYRVCSSSRKALCQIHQVNEQEVEEVLMMEIRSAKKT